MLEMVLAPVIGFTVACVLVGAPALYRHWKGNRNAERLRRKDENITN